MTKTDFCLFNLFCGRSNADAAFESHAQINMTAQMIHLIKRAFQPFRLSDFYLHILIFGPH